MEKGEHIQCNHFWLYFVVELTLFPIQNKVFKENKNGNLKEWLVSLNLFYGIVPFPLSFLCPQT